MIFNLDVLGSEKRKNSETPYISKLSAAFLRVTLVILSGMMWISKIVYFEI